MTATAIAPTVTIERVSAGTLARVWACWTDPSRLAQWWGPHGWTTDIHEFDLRPGGVWRYCLRDASGESAPVWGRADFVAVETQARLVFRESRTDASGAIVDTDPRLTSVEFEAFGGATRLRISTRFTDDAQRDAYVAGGMRAGYEQALDRLESKVSTWR